MEDNKNYERDEHLEDITDASMKDDDYFNASRNIDRKYITVEGARAHNLKNINVKIPRDKFVVVTGLSGSGKSSLAFDTIYAEGQRRYMESLSSYARQFLGQAEKPDVDKIEGLSPAISIDQKSTNRNPRSTVGTVTEIYDYFRLLYARVGIPHCPNCGKVISRQTVDQMVDEIMKLPERTKFMVLAPVVRGRKGEHVKLLEKAKKSGFVRVIVDGSMYELSEEIKLDKNKKHSIDIVIDRLVVRQDVERRLTDSIETALQLAEGLMKIEVIGARDENGIQKENTVINFSDSFSCPPRLSADHHINDDRRAEYCRDRADADLCRGEGCARNQVAQQAEYPAAKKTRRDHQKRLCRFEQRFHQMRHCNANEGNGAGKRCHAGGQNAR